MVRSKQLLATVLVAAFAVACASRRVPASFPSTAPAAPDAAPAPLPDVGRVVTEEPPLPGEPTTGWPGLDETKARGTHAH